MLVNDINKASQLWHDILDEIDRLIRSSSVGSDVQRIVSQTSFDIKQYFIEIHRRHSQLRDYVTNIPTHYKHCEIVYQNLYIEMYNILDKTGVKINNDGHTRHNVPIDPNSALNLIQTDVVKVSLVLENESVLKYPISTLNVPNIEQKMAHFESYYNDEVDAIQEKLIIPQCNDSRLCELLSLLENHLTLIRTSIISLTKSNDQVQLAYHRCSQLISLLESLITLIRNEEKNVMTMRDNIIVKFMVSTELYRTMTQAYYLTQSTISSPNIKPLF